MTDMLGYMAKNEEYIGWTVWAAGAMWGTASPCCTSGGKYGSFEPGSLAADGSPGFVAFFLLFPVILLERCMLTLGSLQAVHNGLASGNSAAASDDAAVVRGGKRARTSVEREQWDGGAACKEDGEEEV